MVTGAQGTLVISHFLDTDITPFAYTSYYSDDDTPSETQCTGDAYEYGESGDWVDQAIPDTNPTTGSNYMNTTRIIYYEPPGQPVQEASDRDNEARNPLLVSVFTYEPGSPVPALSILGMAVLALLVLVAAATVAGSRLGPPLIETADDGTAVT